MEIGGGGAVTLMALCLVHPLFTVTLGSDLGHVITLIALCLVHIVSTLTLGRDRGYAVTLTTLFVVLRNVYRVSIIKHVISH